MVNIQNYIPPRPSGELTSVLLGDGAMAMKVLVSVSGAASFMILMSGAFYPCAKVVRSWFVFVPAVGIAMSVIVSVFGAIMHYLTPFSSFAVLLHNFLSYGKRLTVSAACGLGCHGWACANGVARVHSLFQ